MQDKTWKNQIKNAAKKMHLDETPQSEITDIYLESVVKNISAKLTNSSVTYIYDCKKDRATLEIVNSKMGIVYRFEQKDIWQSIRNCEDSRLLAEKITSQYRGYILGKIFASAS